MPLKVRSQQHKRDPTGSQRKINVYERKLTTLFKNYKNRVVAELEKENARTLESPSWKKPVIVNVEGFNLKLENIEKEVLLDPSKNVIEVEIPEAYRAGGTWGSIQLGAPYEKRVDEWKKIGVLVEKNKQAFSKITYETGGQIRSIIASGVIDEKNLGEILNDIMDTVDDVGVNRATMMARTEIMTAVNTGVHDRYKAAGVTKEEWLTCMDFTDDNNPCEECENNNGKFLPDDIAEWPPAHPNCRCTTIPVIEIPEVEEE